MNGARFLERSAVVYCINANYLDAAAISAISVWDCLRHPESSDLVICLENDVEPNESRDFALKLKDACGAPVKIMRPEGSDQQSKVVQSIDAGKFTTASLRRIQLPHLLQAYKRILYLDADTLAVSRLPDLCSVPLKNRPFAAARDAFVRTWGHDGGIPGVDGRQDEKYFNAGVLLIDPMVWVESGVTRAAIAYLQENSSNLRYFDQDALNVAARGKWIELAEAWNYMHAWDIEDDLRAGAKIIHSSGGLKFWDDDFPTGTRRQLYYLYQKRWTAAMESYPKRRGTI